MRKYLSYGGGVNSTAMLLLLLDEGWEFESVYVDHGCDWPETREYVQMMAERYPITILKPEVYRKRANRIYTDLFEYCESKSILPSVKHRWCTREFKLETISAHIEAPCFMLIGFDTDESHRAEPSCYSGIENRWPLLEYEISRNKCIEIIKSHGLPVPIKSGCFICPFQNRSQWMNMRKDHPDLFCKAKRLERSCVDKQLRRGKKPFYINKIPLDAVVDEKQTVIWPEMKPPCSCGL